MKNTTMDSDFQPEYLPEKQQGPDSSTIIFNILGDMIDDIVEKEYTAVIKFRGKKLSKGFSIGGLKIAKNEKSL